MECGGDISPLEVVVHGWGNVVRRTVFGTLVCESLRFSPSRAVEGSGS